MSHEDDRQLASEIEDALRALGIVNGLHGADRRVEPFVRELRAGENRISAERAAAEQQDTDSVR